MSRFFTVALFCTVALLCRALPQSQAALPATTVIPTRSGAIRITAKFHASTQLEYGGKVIVVDPIGFGSWTRKADVILITHPHADHLDLPTIAKLKKPSRATTIYAPINAIPQIKTILNANAVALSPGEAVSIAGKRGKPAIWIRAVRMYNLVRGPQPGKMFHPREARWNGYVLALGGKRIYFAGDTEYIPEMRNLRDIDVAFLPMNLPYTMPPAEAARAARSFKPRLVIPYHYRYPFNKDSGNERTFARMMRGSGIRVLLLNWYPASGVKKMMAANAGK